MFDTVLIIIVLVAYMVLLFFMAMGVEKKFTAKSGIVDNALIYALSLTVYCTTWTYYGSIGKAATSGMLFVTFFLGPTLTFILGWVLLRKLIRIKTTRKITSIADFISARYGKSQLIAAIVTSIALIGISPYIALQLKSLISTFKIITAGNNPDILWLQNNTGIIIVVTLIAFTILFGVRRLDPTERHPGIIFIIAVEAIVKLVVFLIAGIFVTYFIYNGLGDIFNQTVERKLLLFSGNDSNYYVIWMTSIILSMSACIFLPRQFHVAVVENFNENHIKTAMWFFPLYLFLINIFVLPVALAGLLKGYSIQEADTFLLSLPVSVGHKWISLLVFLGGFSAGTGMIMICSMTLATMITNHLILPLSEYIKILNFLKRHILKCRWVAVAVVILLGYWFELKIGNSYMLVNIGTISFAAVIQFAPSIIGGIFWDRGNSTGALLGLLSGFFIWFYTLLLPSFIKSGWLSQSILDAGPYGIEFLKPEQLLGLKLLDPLSHCVFWSLFFNTGLYVLCSLYVKQSEQEYKEAMEFVNILQPLSPVRKFTGNKTPVDLMSKTNILENLLSEYFPKPQAREIIGTVLSKFGLTGKEKISLKKMADIYSEFEKKMTGIIGSPSANMAMKKIELFTPNESRELTELYTETIAELNITPEELKRKIDYYREKQELLKKHAMELEKKIKEREDEIVLRKKVEEEVKQLNEELEQRVALRTSELEEVNKELKAFAYSISHDLRAPLRSIDGFSLILLEDYTNKLDDEGKDYLQRIRSNSQKMATLIEHILKLSQVAHMEISLKQVNLSDMVKNILDDLKHNDRERNVDTVIKEGIIVYSDEILMARVMENLLNNAWKYTSKHASAIIEFGMIDHEGRPAYFIRDNGAGFDMSYSNKLFGIFQRLHGTDEFTGIGVGLATVQRIIHRLGGQIWAEGEIEKGATFYFTLS